jgi:hypothetical protein
LAGVYCAYLSWRFKRLFGSDRTRKITINCAKGNQVKSSQNRKLLSGLLALVVAVALLAVYILYGRSRHEQPNKPPESPAESSLREPAAGLPTRLALQVERNLCDTACV